MKTQNTQSFVFFCGSVLYRTTNINVSTVKTGVTVKQDDGAKHLKLAPMFYEYFYSPRVLLLHRFNTFHLEASSACNFDYVAVYDGQNTLAPFLGRFCGAVLPPDLRSSNNNLFLVFVTDSSVNGIGWRATYSQTLGRLMLLKDTYTRQVMMQE